MAKAWFKRRDRGMGFGYGVASVEGLIALLAFIAIAVGGMKWLMTWAARQGINPALAGTAAALVLMAGFFLLVKLKSED